MSTIKTFLDLNTCQHLDFLFYMSTFTVFLSHLWTLTVFLFYMSTLTDFLFSMSTLTVFLFFKSNTPIFSVVSTIILLLFSRTTLYISRFFFPYILLLADFFSYMSLLADFLCQPKYFFSPHVNTYSLSFSEWNAACRLCGRWQIGWHQSFELLKMHHEIDNFTVDRHSITMPKQHGRA